MLASVLVLVVVSVPEVTVLPAAQEAPAVQEPPVQVLFAVQELSVVQEPPMQELDSAQETSEVLSVAAELFLSASVSVFAEGA